MNRTVALVSLVVIGIVVILVVVAARRPWAGCSADDRRGAVTTTDMILKYPPHISKPCASEAKSSKSWSAEPPVSILLPK